MNKSSWKQRKNIILCVGYTCKVVPAAITSSQQTAVVQMYTRSEKTSYFKHFQAVIYWSTVKVNIHVKSFYKFTFCKKYRPYIFFYSFD